MRKSFLKAQARRFYLKALERAAARCNEADLRRSALVFSPHFDDETLGCGGTILKKTRAGATVKIVFMTDGSKSHHLISEELLRTIRRREGSAAAQALGLKANDAIFLDFEDTKLEEHRRAAIDRVRQILADQRPDEVFIPYHGEPRLGSLDHLATNRIVVSALKEVGAKMRICEYPIWFWCHWPWARLPLRQRRDILKHIRNHSFLHGVRLLRDFQYVVPVGEMLDLKRAALAEHKSQMTRLIPTTEWRTLHDVADGEFLECFFHPCEIFHIRGL